MLSKLLGTTFARAASSVFTKPNAAHAVYGVTVATVLGAAAGEVRAMKSDNGESKEHDVVPGLSRALVAGLSAVD